MLKNKTINLILSVFIAIILCFIFTDDFSIIHKTYGFDIPIIETDPSENYESKVVDELQKTYQNNEIVGLLEIPNSDFRRVITKGSDNDKYLTYNAYGVRDNIGNPYLDYRVNIGTDDKLLIYGHNAKTTDAPFKYLDNYYDYEFFKDHKYITISTNDKKLTYEVFSVYVETEDWSYYRDIKFNSKDDWLRHLNKLKNKSIYDTSVSVNENDRILILQTCSTKSEYKNLKRKFLLIISREVE